MRLALSALFLVGFLFGSAGADRKVDWSQYLEKPGERKPPTRATPVVAKQDTKTPKKAKATRAAQRPAKAAAKRKGRRR